MQTALGVAGGIMVASALTGFLSPDGAAAAEPGSGELEADQDLPEQAAADRNLPEAADDLGGDLDFGEFQGERLLAGMGHALGRSAARPRHLDAGTGTW